jgi:hypothetical protein
MNQIHNDQAKLFALFLNNLAVAVIAAGVFGAYAGWTLRLSTAPPASDESVVATLVWIMVGVALHWLGKIALLSLRP